MKVSRQHIEELEQRLEAVDYAVAAQRMEGLIVPKETVEDMRRVARGEMTSEQAREALFRRFECL